ncbi:MAG: hypothetical protein OXB92_11395 [Acidimicrobiaceae bacterium]|nr:cytochrome P450 [Acidimicrobiia bacterium]MCY4494448.1 hypothetical protein [Acidimicrobiaceae bacterium]
MIQRRMHSARSNGALHLIHHCVGASLARMETHCAIKRLLAETNSFSLVYDDPPRRESSMFVRRHEYLPLDISWN